jgi:hypothetical protein
MPRFAVGHLALGYILGWGSAKLLKTKIVIPVALALSVVPDIDILFQHLQLLEHRGPMHSVIVMLLVFVPIFAIYHQKAVPYFLALVSHPLIGDFIAGGKADGRIGIQLFWSLTTNYYGLPIGIDSPLNIALEWSLFLVATVILVKTRDLLGFFQAHKSNLILSVPVFTALLPTVLSYPLDVPVWLLLPHLFYIVLFTWSIAIALRSVLKE